MKQVARPWDMAGYMEAVNKYYRIHRTLVGCPFIPEADARRMTTNMKSSNAGYDEPFPNWMIQQERAKGIQDDAV